MYQQPRLKVADLMMEHGVAERTVKEDLKRLAGQSLIIYQGSKKTGGYTLSQELHDKLHDKRA